MEAQQPDSIERHGTENQNWNGITNKLTDVNGKTVANTSLDHPNVAGCLNNNLGQRLDPHTLVNHHYGDLEKRHIRLLKLVESFNADQAYDLVETSLDAAPPYETISYVWGKQERSQTLAFQSSGTIRVTLSLEDTLARLRSQCQTGYLWADQICINQSNTIERNQQVEIMGEIYSKAQRVLIWLGSEGDDYRHITTLLDVASVSFQQQETFDQFSLKVDPILNDNTNAANGCRRSSIRQLLALPWFCRAWVVQEAVLSNIATCFLGSSAFDLYALWSLVRKVRNLEDRINSGGDFHLGIRQLRGYLVLNEIMRLRQQRQNKKDACFYYSLSILAPRCQTSKPQDKIFAFLGLLDDQRIRISPDYNMALNETPAMTTGAILNGTGSLDLFGVLHRHDEDESEWSYLPSWVPDWSRRLKAEAMVFPGSPTYFNASRGFFHRAKLDIRSTWSQMLVVGKIIDEVAFRIPFTQGIAPPTSSRQGWDVSSYLDIPRIREALKQFWPPDLSSPSIERVLTAVLADGSFAFDEVERSRCRNGLLAPHIQELLGIYDFLKFPASGYEAKRKEIATALRDHARIAWSRALIVGKRWDLGLAHETAGTGDVICIVHGSKVPLILRRVADGQYLLMGQCYLEGCMCGETVTWDEQDADEFILI
jgi:hypothetical protein